SQTYRSLCAPCHGLTGKGDGEEKQVDDRGVPIRPRDFTRGIFKSGRIRDQLYARALVGMPGTPMPGAGTLKPPDVADVINYVLSLSDPQAHLLVEHRRTCVTVKGVADSLPEEIPDTAWQSAPAVPIVVSPLWWRNYVPPALQVRALH